MKLYHTTDQDFSIIDISKSKNISDFGKAFYLTDNLYIAEEFTRNSKFNFPYIKTYSCEIFDDSRSLKEPFFGFKDIKVANLNRIGKIEFIATLFYYRNLDYDFGGLLDENKLENILNCDILVGKIMDNSFYRFYKELLYTKDLQVFASKVFPYKGNQYAFKEKAIKYLKEENNGGVFVWN